MPRGIALLDLDKKELACRWLAGEPLVRIAAWAECSPDHVQRMVTSMGLPSRSTAMRTHVDVPRLFKLWQSDLTRREIALELGIREGHLNKLAVRYGLPPRGQRAVATGHAKIDPFVLPADEYERRKAEVKNLSLARKRLERYEPKDI